MNNILKNIVADHGPILVLDIGAKGGPFFELNNIRDLCCYFCFEPNPAMMKDLPGQKETIQEMTNLKPDAIYTFPYAVTHRTGDVNLYVTRRPGGTSTLKPNADVLGRFSKDNWSQVKDVIKTITVPSITLEEFLVSAGINRVDCLKLDTQGNELDILKSSGNLLKSISVIFVEVEFIQMYEDQPLFHDISLFLHRNGFELVDVKIDPAGRRFHARPDLPYDCYRAIWGDAVFVRTHDMYESFESLYQGFVLAGLGYADIAIDIFDKHKTLSGSEKKQLELFARQSAEPNTFKGKLKRCLERIFGLEIHRYNWLRGKQVKSVN